MRAAAASLVELDAGFASLERALRRVASRHGLEIRASGRSDERELEHKS